MKRFLFSIVACSLFLNSYAQSSSADSGVFLLHKFQQHIGEDSYHNSKAKDSIVYKSDFKFVDRGSPVPLKTELKVTPALEPLGLTIKGRVARSATIDDQISIAGGQAHIRVDEAVSDKKLQPLTFPVAGYAPTIVQQVLVQYWKKHHEPANINTLPTGSVQIKRDGSDTLTYNGKQLI